MILGNVMDAGAAIPLRSKAHEDPEGERVELLALLAPGRCGS